MKLPINADKRGFLKNKGELILSCFYLRLSAFIGG